MRQRKNALGKPKFWSDILLKCADVAQLVEQRIRNAKVVSSIPIIGTTLKSLIVS